LGVPILFGEQALGNLYLTDRLDGAPFTLDDLATVQMLAAHAGAAIDRARLYRAMEEQRDELRVILDHLPAGVLIQSAPDGRLELANASAIAMLLGEAAPRGATPVSGRDYRVLRPDGAPTPPEERPERRALRGEAVRNQQLTLARWDGVRRPVLAQAAPLPDATGAINRAVVVYQDITQLRAAEQLKDDFLALISHEFRTPLTAIHGGARLLETDGESLDAATRREVLADVVVESGRLERMLANLLDLAAVMAGRLEPRTEPVLFGPLARAVVAEAAPRAPGCEFVVDVPAALPPAEGDPELLTQVLRNLYENAVKYSPQGGEIRTSATSDDGWVALRITDRGCGIASEHVPFVFERFRRPGADPTVRGMGLGLYLSRLLTEAQGGRITASSPGVGQGATFAVALPIAQGWDEAGNGETAATG
ncbi:MAG TPA: ATP-binding protein, partial [Thermomicrobiales bacterium]|nr:ATP-binding protein [Thermomicrobiales bacterium]